eukprot:COSAG03_NODE_324_length_8972_cov_5.452271_2_plen_67_part_00
MGIQNQNLNANGGYQPLEGNLEIGLAAGLGGAGVVARIAEVLLRPHHKRDDVEASGHDLERPLRES